MVSYHVLFVQFFILFHLIMSVGAVPVAILAIRASLTHSFFLCLAERHGLREPQKVEQLQMKIISSLRDHVTYNSEAQKKSHYFSKILSKLPELRTLSIHGLQRIFYLKLEESVKIPEFIENMFAATLPYWNKVMALVYVWLCHSVYGRRRNHYIVLLLILIQYCWTTQIYSSLNL